MVARHSWLALATITGTILGTTAVILTRFIGAARHRLLAVPPAEAIRTHTSVATHLVATITVLTRTRKTFVNVERAIALREASFAATKVIIFHVHALLGPLSPTRIRLALVDVFFATLPFESRLTVARKVANTVCAVAAVKAGVLGAIVGVAIAVTTDVAAPTLTVKLIDEIKTSTVLTRVRQAFVYIRSTISSCEPGQAFACVVHHTVNTASPIFTRSTSTIINVFLTVRASEPR